MPIKHTDKGWYWGSKGPFATRAQAQKVANAAYANGYKEESIMNVNVVAEFVGALLHSATITHFMHLRTKSYAQHVALNAYYDEIVELVDSLAEAIQGLTHTIVEPYPMMFANSEATPLDYIKGLQEYVATNRRKDGFPQETEIQNEVDNIDNLLNSTAYKLEFLA